MLKQITNQIPIDTSQTLNYQFPFSEVSFVLASIGVSYVVFETYRRTKTRVIQEPIESFFDDNTSTRIVNLKIEIKYRDNPFFNRMTLFEYEGNANYKISGYEFNTHQTTISDELFYDWKEGERTKVMLLNKTHFKKRGISRFEVRIEHKEEEYRHKIQEEINPNRIIITNQNDLPVRNYVFSLPKQTDVSRLKDDPRIYDLYPDGRLWIVKIREIPAAGIHDPERMTILI